MSGKKIADPSKQAWEAACPVEPWLPEIPAGPLSPAALTPAVADVVSHAVAAPDYLAETAEDALRQSLRAVEAGAKPSPEKEDHRFADPAWGAPPFCYYASNFLLIEEWLNKAILHTPGVSEHHAKLAAFAARQWLDAFSPSNLPWTNPEVLRATLKENGVNFLHGFENWLEDLRRKLDPKAAPASDNYVVGRDVALTPGKVVLRNELIELIQYAPLTPRTRPEPLLIVPAWIMKYYILDLSPHNSFIRYLVERGFTVFCISWRNPGPELGDTSFDDYRRLGFMAALDRVSAICGEQSIHALGYCIGGTLLAVAAAAMARDGDDRLASLCFLAAQTDFTEPGELKIFIDEPQLDELDRVMARQGYLDASQMAGAFSMLHARDLIWSRMVKSYLLGVKSQGNDLMAWNADATRMPCRMHSTYLRALFLHNDLAEGRFEAGGKKVDLAAIAAPVFAVGTENDHVAPWRSVYKIHRFVSGDVTFLLASGGHNGGIVSEPGHRHRSYRLLHIGPGAEAPPPADYLIRARTHEGSWWPAYADWLDGHSGALKRPPAMGKALADAPGAYVFER